MSDPIRILVKRDEVDFEGIKQFKLSREEWKFDTLCDLYDTLTITQAVIFCNTKRKGGLALRDGRPFSLELHLMASPQKERDAIMKEYAERAVPLSFITDVSGSAGIDVQQESSLVINYDLQTIVSSTSIGLADLEDSAGRCCDQLCQE